MAAKGAMRLPVASQTAVASAIREPARLEVTSPGVIVREALQGHQHLVEHAEVTGEPDLADHDRAEAILVP